MNQFLVYFQESITPEKKQQIESAPLVSGLFQLSERDFVIRSYLSDPKLLAPVVGITGDTEGSAVGVVFRLNGSYWGYFDKDLWNWLMEERHEAATS